MIPWAQNDALFRSELAAGHAWEQWVCRFLQLNDLPAVLQPQRVRPHVSERRAYADSGDLMCCGHVLDIKAVRMRFTSTSDLPYASLIVDSAAKWERKNPRPSAVIIVSRSTGAMICIGPSEIANDKQWREVKYRDKVRRIDEKFKVLPRERWHDISRLVAWLKEEL